MCAGPAPKRVFISYAHEPDPSTLHQQVRSLGDDLRRNGLDAHFDQMNNAAPEEGWYLWMERQIQEADFVLVVCRETYLRRYEQREVQGKGKGAIWEGAIIRQELYDSAGKNKKFAAVLFEPVDEQHIPGPLRAFARFCLPDKWVELLRWLTDQPEYVPPPIGQVPVLPPNP